MKYDSYLKKRKGENRRRYGDFVFLSISACGTIVQLSAEIDKFYLTFSTSAGLSKNEFFDKPKGFEPKLEAFVGFTDNILQY